MNDESDDGLRPEPHPEDPQAGFADALNAREDAAYDEWEAEEASGTPAEARLEEMFRIVSEVHDVSVNIAFAVLLKQPVPVGWLVDLRRLYDSIEAAGRDDAIVHEQAHKTSRGPFDGHGWSATDGQEVADRFAEGMREASGRRQDEKRDGGAS